MYDVCHVSAACRKGYEIEKDQSWLFSLFKLKKCRMLVCCVLNSVRDREWWSHLTFSLLKPEKWTVFVTFSCMPNRVPGERIQYSGDSGLGSNGTLHFISKEEAIVWLLEIHLSLSGVCKVVGLNSLVRQFGLRFQCNGIKQLAKDFLKACATFHSTLPFLQFPLQHTLSTSYGPFEWI